MDKGIRQAARNLFVAQNELRRRGEAPYTGARANTAFRKAVMCQLMEDFGITLASAATHYNDAFKFIRELNSELVSGLGRAEDKKGGRRPQQTPAAAVVEQGAALALGGPVETAVGAVQVLESNLQDLLPALF